MERVENRLWQENSIVTKVAKAIVENVDEFLEDSQDDDQHSSNSQDQQEELSSFDNQVIMSKKDVKKLQRKNKRAEEQK